jgi:arginyl-tRNA--protein-N-Asp/Glu arginylyltransferase
MPSDAWLPENFINEFFLTESVNPDAMDILWSRGWRHFGPQFFRYSVMVDGSDKPSQIHPLRLHLRHHMDSKSQRRVLRRNGDTDVRIVPAAVGPEQESLFFRHRTRFRSNVPESLRDFMGSDHPATDPCRCVSVEVRIGERLAAVSYLDVGSRAVSSVYAMFDPDESHRSLGIFTLLKEIHWARDAGMEWLYPGYATAGPGIYDYKKSLRPLQRYDWHSERWLDLAPETGSI